MTSRDNAGDLPPVLLPYQQRLIRTTAVNTLTVAPKSRRIGFTWGVAADAVLTASAAREAGGMDTLYIGYNLAMAREFIDTCQMWVRSLGVQVVGKVQPGAWRVGFASGFDIQALSSRPRSLRGRQGYVVIDEAAFHDDLPELLKAALAMLIWGGKVLVVSTHNGALNPFNLLVEEIRGGTRAGALAEVYFDEALQDGLYRRICLVQRKAWSPEGEAAWRRQIVQSYGDGADEELFGLPSAGSGAYLPPELIERQQRPDIPVLRWTRQKDFVLLPDGLREQAALEFCETEIAPALARLDPALSSWFGEDFGRTGDLTVIWPVQIGADMVRRPPFIIELRQVPFAQQRQILWYVLDHLPRLAGGAMDATGNGAAIAEETATRYGVARVRQVKISAAWYAEIGPQFRRAFEDGLTELPRDREIWQDHRALRRDGASLSIPRTGGDRHGDAAIAHMMALHATRLDTASGLLDYYRDLSAAPVPVRGARRR